MGFRGFESLKYLTILLAFLIIRVLVLPLRKIKCLLCLSSFLIFNKMKFIGKILEILRSIRILYFP